MKIIKYESEIVFNLINNAVMTFNNLALIIFLPKLSMIKSKYMCLT